MSIPCDRPLRVAAFGFDERSCEGFRWTFRGPGKGKAQLVDMAAADVGMINMDAADAQRLLAECQQRYPDRPVIKFSVKAPGQSDNWYVKKPASIDAMLATVDKLRQSLETDPPGAPARRPADSPANFSAGRVDGARSSTRFAVSGKPKSALFYSPKEYLQGEIHAAVDYARSRERVVELWLMSGADEWQKIIFLPRLQRVITSLSNKELQSYCASPLQLIHHKLYQRNEKESAIIQGRMEQQGRGLSQESFLWKVGLFTSRGRLPEGTRLEAAAQLKQWPNLPRLLPVAGGMRIATLLVDQPRPLPLVAKVLKIPAARVFAFYSAACAIGIVSDDYQNVELAKQSLPQRHRDHTLLGRILKRLNKHRDSDVELSA